MTVCITSGAMASGDAGVSRPRVDHSGSVFAMSYRHHGMRQPYVNLESSGVVELDTSVVPDVLGLRALFENAEPTRVLPVRAQHSVRVFVPEARATPMGFHDVTLVDLTGVSGLPVSMGEMATSGDSGPLLC